MWPAAAVALAPLVPIHEQPKALALLLTLPFLPRTSTRIVPYLVAATAATLGVGRFLPPTGRCFPAVVSRFLTSRSLALARMYTQVYAASPRRTAVALSVAEWALIYLNIALTLASAATVCYLGGEQLYDVGALSDVPHVHTQPAVACAALAFS